MKNHNQKYPLYIESDLSKQQFKIPPRNRKKEVKLYFYKTNEKTTKVTDDKVTSSVISPVFEKAIDFNSTTPINPDIAQPKFANITDSATWGSQLNGIIYEAIEWDNELYSFMSFTLLQSNTIAKSYKYRIISYSPIYDNDNKFLYATIQMVKETTKTIPNLERVTWKLTNKIIIDSKTKYFKISLPPSSLLYSKGIIIYLTDDNGVERIPGIIVNKTTEMTYKLIKIRNTNPFIFDDLTFKNFKEINKNGIDGLYAWENERPIFGQNAGKFPAQPKKTSKEIVLYAGSTDIDNTYNGYKNYFSNGLKWKGKGTNRLTITENVMDESELQRFIAGGVSFDGEVIPYDPSDLSISGEIKSLSSLDATNTEDKKYFVASKTSDFKKFPIEAMTEDFFTSNGDREPIAIIAWLAERKTIPLGGGSISFPGRKPNEVGKYDLINSNEFLNQLIDNEPITIELEASLSGKNPKIEMEISNAEYINISTYDENHTLLLDNIKVDTEFKYNNNKKKTLIQL